MAWQRTGCSHDGGTNVLGQVPRDYGQVSPRGVVGDTTFRQGGDGYTSPREYEGAGNQTDRGGKYCPKQIQNSDAAFQLIRRLYLKLPFA